MLSDLLECVGLLASVKNQDIGFSINLEVNIQSEDTTQGRQYSAEDKNDEDYNILILLENILDANSVTGMKASIADTVISCSTEMRSTSNTEQHFQSCFPLTRNSLLTNYVLPKYKVTEPLKMYKKRVQCANWNQQKC